MGEERHAWNEGAAHWVDLARGGGDPSRLAHDDAIRSLLPAPSGLTLDLGCGEGRFTRELRANGYDVVGVDRSDALLAAAREADPDGRYVLAEAEALPFGDGDVALVLCVNVLPHVVDLAAVAAELARILGDDGVLVAGLIHPVAEAGTYDEERDELRLRGYFAREEHAIPLGGHHVLHQHRTIEHYVRAFLEVGFALDDLREVGNSTGAFPRYLDLRLSRRP